MFNDVKVVLFRNIPVGNKFATEADGKIVVWIKIDNQFRHYESNAGDQWAPYAPNAVSVFDGFPATFELTSEVAEINT
jgi:hypothetical protein